MYNFVIPKAELERQIHLWERIDCWCESWRQEHDENGIAKFYHIIYTPRNCKAHKNEESIINWNLIVDTLDMMGYTCEVENNGIMTMTYRPYMEDNNE